MHGVMTDYNNKEQYNAQPHPTHATCKMHGPRELKIKNAHTAPTKTVYVRARFFVVAFV